MNNGVVACALERYFIAEGRYPDETAALVPNYLPHLPIDVITGDQLHYVLREDGRPAIWSVGINRRDDEGVPRKNMGYGDWAWQYSPPPGFQLKDLWGP
ncbi:MAG: hypothetical protein KDN22_05585 [Verrucomicrobiae bacterium]|nr:hypothetical protein [Verrucomicrobiae bacterium]